ncbi:hypothetical protein, partial [Teichococcus cervicalis]
AAAVFVAVAFFGAAALLVLAAGFFAVAFAVAAFFGAAALVAAGLRPAVLALRVALPRRVLLLITMARARGGLVSLLSLTCWISLPVDGCRAGRAIQSGARQGPGLVPESPVSA